MLAHSLTRTVDPVGLAVPLPDVKASLRITHADQEAMITDLIHDAAAKVETDTQRALMPQTWRADYNRFAPRLYLSRGPVSAISSVTYLDADGARQTLDAAVYELIDADDYPHIIAAHGQQWPDGVLCRPASVQVTFTAGYADADAIPRELRRAVQQLAEHWYENSGLSAPIEIHPVLRTYDDLTGPWRLIRGR